MTQELVKCTNLSRSFGEIRALNDVNLSLPSGRIIGLLGPNGSGKTTLIKILNGLLQPTSGEARIAGNLPGVESKKLISYLPDRGYFPEWMNVGDMIDMFADFYADFDRAKADEMCRALGLERSMRIKTLSKGTREKMQLMLVMSRRARLYLLDEPIAGVDPAAREFIMASDPRRRAGARRGGVPASGQRGAARERGQHPRTYERQCGPALPRDVPHAGLEWRGRQCSVN